MRNRSTIPTLLVATVIMASLGAIAILFWGNPPSNENAAHQANTSTQNANTNQTLTNTGTSCTQQEDCRTTCLASTTCSVTAQLYWMCLEGSCQCSCLENGTEDRNTNTAANVNQTVTENTNVATYEDYAYAELLADYQAGTMRLGTFRTFATFVDYQLDPVAFLIGDAATATETVPLLTENFTGYSLGQQYVISFRVTEASGTPTFVIAGQPAPQE